MSSDKSGSFLIICASQPCVNTNVLKLKFEVTGGTDHAMELNLDTRVSFYSNDRLNTDLMRSVKLEFIEARMNLIVTNIKDKILKLNSRESRVK